MSTFGLDWESYCSGPLLVLRKKGDTLGRVLNGKIPQTPWPFVIVDDRETDVVRLERASYAAVSTLVPDHTAAVYAQINAARAVEETARALQLSRDQFWPRVHVMRPTVSGEFGDPLSPGTPTISSEELASLHPPAEATAETQSSSAVPKYRGVGWTSDGCFVVVEDGPAPVTHHCGA